MSGPAITHKLISELWCLKISRCEWFRFKRAETFDPHLFVTFRTSGTRIKAKTLKQATIYRNSVVPIRKLQMLHTNKSVLEYVYYYVGFGVLIAVVMKSTGL
jgi:hypothetical protein